MSGTWQQAVAQADLPRVAAPDSWNATVSSERPKKARSAGKGNATAAKTAPEVPDVSGSVESPGGASRLVRNAVLSGDGARTRFVIEMTAKAPFAIFRMTNPSRVVIDIDDVEFRLPQGSGRQERGLVTSYRYGLFAAGKARIVVDTSGPVRIEAARIKEVAGDPVVRLVIDLVPTTATEAAAAEIADAAQAVDLKPTETSAVKLSKARSKPVIVVDPGHGGIDPGAQGAHGQEKDVVLAVSREIQRSLLALRRFEVVMTRSTDVFVALDQRVRISRQAQADLFLSVHADSLAQKELAQNIRGATIYTLSDRASDDRAQLLAEKENASDLLAGLNVNGGSNDDQVRNILFDLVRRESANFATDFRGRLLTHLRPKMTLAKDPARSAPFKVLRQPGSPAVLIELGYMSNAQDEKLMESAAWQKSVGDAVAKAVDAFFARRAG